VKKLLIVARDTIVYTAIGLACFHIMFTIAEVAK